MQTTKTSHIPSLLVLILGGSALIVLTHATWYFGDLHTQRISANSALTSTTNQLPLSPPSN